MTGSVADRQGRSTAPARPWSLHLDEDALPRALLGGFDDPLEAAVGDALSEDDPIVILESMKMEIPIAAPSDGKVVEILVENGKPVEYGDRLFKVSKA